MFIHIYTSLLNDTKLKYGFLHYLLLGKKTFDEICPYVFFDKSMKIQIYYLKKKVLKLLEKNAIIFSCKLFIRFCKTVPECLTVKNNMNLLT